MVDAQGSLYVAETESGRILMQARDGSRVSWNAYEEGWFVRPTDVAVDTTYPKDRVFVRDWLNHQVLVFEQR